MVIISFLLLDASQLTHLDCQFLGQKGIFPHYFKRAPTLVKPLILDFVINNYQSVCN